MIEQNAVTTVQQAYSAFQRADMAALMALMSDTVDWQFYGPDELPTSGARHGRNEVQHFFVQVAATWAFDHFEPREIVAQGDRVISLGHYDGKAIPSGRGFSSHFAHDFTVRDGQIVRFREYSDTAMLLSAFTGSESMV